DNAREHVAAMDEMAVAPPVEKAGGALAGELRPARARQRRQMRVGEMRQHEHAAILAQARYELPITIPAMNTSTPPTTTWNAAAKNGVSMKRWRIQEMTASSTATTMMATTVA